MYVPPPPEALLKGSAFSSQSTDKQRFLKILFRQCLLMSRVDCPLTLWPQKTIWFIYFWISSTCVPGLMSVKHWILKILSSHNHLIILCLKCSTFEPLTFRLHDLVLKNHIQNDTETKWTEKAIICYFSKNFKNVFYKYLPALYVIQKRTNLLWLETQ